ncbi:universal stress protein [Martelella alba]|nr:universal stress protein [Martelella alba]
MYYHHALVLAHDEQDGAILLAAAVELAADSDMKITLGHIQSDWRLMNYVSDSLMDDREAQDVIAAKNMLSRVAGAVAYPVDTLELVSMRRFDELRALVADKSIDLVITGHHNRFMGVLTSGSMDYINHLSVDILIKHLKME